MSGVVTNSGADYLMDLMSASDVPVAVYYVALITGEAPSFTATGEDLDEPTTADYVRAPYENISGNWLTVNGVLSNTLEIDFPTTSTDWGNVSHWALCDEAVGGRALFVGSLVDAVVAGIGEQLFISPGGISVAISNPEWQVYL